MATTFAQAPVVLNAGNRRGFGSLFLLPSLIAVALNAGAAEKLRITNPDVLRFPLGSHFELLPMLDVSESYNDNIFYNDRVRRSQNLGPGNSADSMITRIQAGFELAHERRRNRYALQYALRSLNFHSSPNDDYVDQMVGGKTHFEFTRRHRLDLTARFIDGHFQRGTNFSQLFETTLDAEPDQYHQWVAEGQYRYGAPTAKGNLELKFHFDDLNFQNNRARTAGFDRADTIITPGFYYRLFPKTYLLTQVEIELLDYHNDLALTPTPLSNQPGQDYDKERYFVGVTWELSKKTVGTARIGYLQQNFDSSSSLKGVTDFTWDVGVTWFPQTYSRISLNLSRDARPTLGFGNLRLVDSYIANWRHEWTDRVASFVEGAYVHVDNVGVNRLDDIVYSRVGLNYAFRPWLNVGVDYSYGNQDSGAIYRDLNYHQNIAMLYISTNRTVSDRIGLPW